MMAKLFGNKYMLFSIAGVLVVASLILGSSLYGQKSLATESNKITVPFPAGVVTKPATLEKPGGGKVSVKPVSVDVNKRGLPKKVLNPGVEKISISSLTNVDTAPHRIGVKLTGSDIRTKIDVKAGIPWDDQTSTFATPVAPGQSVPDISFSIYLFFTAESKTQSTWFEGKILVFDADTGENLTVLPVKYFTGGQQ
jgi:hypothetical protein